MKIKFNLILIAIIYFIGCSSKIYNTPFIDIDETINLQFGLSKNQVQKLMNDPLYVSYGNKDEIKWVYEVRSFDVKSKNGPNGLIIPSKRSLFSSSEKNTKPIHKLSLTFINNELSKWEVIN